jgi:hypothetical protein
MQGAYAAIIVSSSADNTLNVDDPLSKVDDIPTAIVTNQIGSIIRDYIIEKSKQPVETSVIVVMKFHPVN